MTDIDLLIEVYGKYRHLARPVAVERVATQYNLSISGVSGRVTRAYATVAGRTALMAYLSNNVGTGASNAKINTIVQAGREKLNDFNSQTLEGKYVIYVPDMHVPRQHNQALELLYKVVEDLPNVAAISVLNDGFDFARLSRWADRRNEADIDADMANCLEIYVQHIAILQMVAPDAILPAIIGNHDLRVLADDGKGTGSYSCANMMQTLHDAGVTFNSDMSRENTLVFNDVLVWAHGYRAMANRASSALANYSDIMRHVPGRRIYDLAIGHTHSAGVYPTKHGATVYSAGCMCNMQPTYMRKRPDWQLGFVVSRLTDNDHETYLIEIKERNGNLVVFNPFLGREYRVIGTIYD